MCLSAMFHINVDMLLLFVIAVIAILYSLEMLNSWLYQVLIAIWLCFVEMIQNGFVYAAPRENETCDNVSMHVFWLTILLKQMYFLYHYV